MPFTLTMPKLSPTMEEGTIVKWHKKIGEYVKPDDVLFEVATDKATVEYSALDGGWLRQILIQEGKEAIVNQPVAVFTIDAKENIQDYRPEGVMVSTPIAQEPQVVGDQQENKKETQPKKKASISQPEFQPEPPLEKYTFEYVSREIGERVLASPLAKKIAKEKGLDLSNVRGTGPNERIMSRDIEKGQKKSVVRFRGREMPSIPPGTYEEQPLTPLRKVIAQRLQEAKSFIPHFYVTQAVDVQSLVEMREQLKQEGISFSMNDFIVKACAFALREHPTINSGYNSTNQTIVQFKTIDIAIAVSIEGGLVTPIIRHADYKNVSEISAEIQILAQKAREGKLESFEYKGGSFTVSNLGMFGVTEFQAILNPPQAAILAVSGIQEIPVVRKGAIVVGKVMNLTLSVDHRVIDGVGAALYLQTLKKIIESPSLLLLN